MPSRLDGHVARVKQLLDVQTAYLDAFLRLRCRETDLDFYIMKCSCAGYIEWCAIASAAAVQNLTKRKWNETLIPFESMVDEALKYAQRKPVEGERRAPTLLSNSFGLNYFLERLNGTSRILNDDIEYSLKTGIVLLGETEARDITESAQPLVTEASSSISLDARNSTREGRNVPAENLETLDAVILRVKQQLADEAAEARRIADQAAEARQKFSRSHLEDEKMQDKSKQRELVDKERKSMSEKYKPPTSLRPQLKSCRACNGLGGKSCSACGGRGYQSYSRTRTRWDNSVEYYQENISCTHCSGGRVTCTSCGGGGKVVELE